jgi:antitoxin PrlF
MITAKITSKAQTTIPQPVRHHLGVAEGDMLGFVLADGHVILTKLRKPAQPEETSVFNEWESAADERSFAGL